VNERRPWPKGEGGGSYAPKKKRKNSTPEKIIKFSKHAVFEVLGLVVLNVWILLF